MNPEDRRLQNPSLQLYLDLKTENSGQTSFQINKKEECQKHVKEEETDEDELWGETSIAVEHLTSSNQQNEEEANDDYLYCEECHRFYFNKCEVHGPTLFIPNTFVPTGVLDRARRTLPQGLEVKRSSIPNAGLGVFNKEVMIRVGSHFGPYEGELVEREEAMNSRYSWVIYRSRQCEEFIAARRETCSNWMRYVNCARNREEQNLVVFQYQGGILYRCCRPIQPGQELLLWYDEKYAKNLSFTFDYIWNRKSSSEGSGDSWLQVFSCTLCSLSSKSQVQLQEHFRRHHFEDYMRLLKSGEVTYDAVILSSSLRSEQTPCDSLNHDPDGEKIQEDMHQCSDCTKSFTQESVLQVHRCVPAGEKPYSCTQCGKTFTNICSLQTHQSLCTRKNLHPCLHCGKSFAGRAALTKHRRIHACEGPFSCSYCGQSFTQQSHLQEHLHLHMGEKSHNCSYCQRTFIKFSSFRTHLCVQNKTKVHQCSQCEKTFMQHSDLQTHRRIHTGEKPYCCSECGKSFTQQSSLQRHRRIHTGEKPYQCSHCGKSFTQQATLQHHQSIHTGEKPYHCFYCEKSFTKITTLRTHQRLHTGEKPYCCDTCGRSFNEKGAFLKHQRVHTGEKPYRCDECGRSFTQQIHLKQHQRTHTGEKPYQCMSCGRSFTNSRTLKTHKCVNVQPSALILINMDFSG